MKVCARCATAKPPEGFYTLRNGRLTSYCRVCSRRYTLDWRIRFPGRRLAHRRVETALKYGELIRPNICEHCREATYTVAHHEDYRKPLEVVWLCDVCHAKRHVELRLKAPPEPK